MERPSAGACEVQALLRDFGELLDLGHFRCEASSLPAPLGFGSVGRASGGTLSPESPQLTM